MNERRLFEIYVTDALKAIADNTARALMRDGITMSKRYADLLQESEAQRTERTQEEETRTAAEIINNIKTKLNKLGG